MKPTKPKAPRIAFERRLEAYRVRNRANLLAQSRAHPTHKSNGEENDPSLNGFTSFRKGLRHTSQGLVSAANYSSFRKACEGQSLAPFELLDTGYSGKKFRKWESPTAGAYYDLEGPDAQAVTMPPAPRLGSDELAMEMAEVYLMALMRDLDFNKYNSSSLAKKAAAALQAMPRGKIRRARKNLKFTTQNLFRGEGPGVTEGKLISQFLLVGTVDISEPKDEGMGVNACASGMIEYGAQLIDQRVRTAKPRLDFMQNLKDWVQVQNGYDVPNISPKNFIEKGASLPQRRFITTGRDISTYVHFDQLYQAYLNACLILLSSKAPFQSGMPHAGAKKTKGFAQFGGPHVLTLVTEVATRALKAVRYQKFTSHRRGRPEQLAGLISQYKAHSGAPRNAFAAMKPLVDQLDCVMVGGQPLLDLVNHHNNGQGHFLPMAFPEGSPMHPSYGAGHATVAGACVTILKAFFDTSLPIQTLYQSTNSGRKLSRDNRGKGKRKLTIEGELNKLAANISIGRNMAGVHYYSDYTESLLMGEEIAIQMLEEQMYTYPEKVKLKLNRFLDGAPVVISN